MDFLLAYLAVFTGTLMEGETVLIAASYASERGYLNFYAVAGIAFTATLLVDWGMFFLGRFQGSWVRKKFPAVERRSAYVHEWLSRNPNALFVYRFLIGLRIVTLLIFGMSGIHPNRFLPRSLLSIVLWTSLYSMAGYFLGALLSDWLNKALKNDIYLLGALGLLLISTVGWYRFRKKRS